MSEEGNPMSGMRHKDPVSFKDDVTKSPFRKSLYFLKVGFVCVKAHKPRRLSLLVTSCLIYDYVKSVTAEAYILCSKSPFSDSWPTAVPC